MNKSKAVIIIESVTILILLLIIGLNSINTNEQNIIRSEEISPNQKYKVVVYQKGDPVFPFGPVTFEVSLQKYNNKTDPTEEKSFTEINTFFVNVSDDGKSGDFKTEWSPQYFKITFLGDEQLPHTIMIPLNENIY
ncbi:MAG: hypothetical protein E7557_03645 [Ruminococcaceae bacterium]|nr:hypothetical protein [Oscillospiraceae bacterium]